MHDSLVEAAFSTARRTVFWILAATFAVVAVLLIERVRFGSAFDQAASDARRAYQIAGQVMLEDERLTMSANMAAATGEPRWIERYEHHIPLIDEAIAAALALATPEAAQRFDQATKIANDLLVEMERAALARVADGDLAGARAILDGKDYQDQKRILADGTTRFVEDLRAAGDQRLAAVQASAFATVIAIMIAALAGFVWLWRVLDRTLATSKAANRHAEERLRVMAMHDELTGLPNRRHFTERVASLVSERDRSGHGLVGVAMIDLDHFKDINDTLGHQAGDDLIREVTRLLLSHLPSGAVLARLGGDELAIALPLLDRADAKATIARVSSAFQSSIQLHGRAVHVTASAGVAFYPDDASQPQEILRLADIALYRAKLEGRGRTKLFQAAMDAQVQARKALEDDLRQALHTDQIFLQYQPLMCGKGTRITGVEALMRWRHPEKGMIPPSLFIPVAEQSGLIGALGEWAMAQAFRDAGRWPGVTVAVNLSPLQFKQPGFVASVERLVAEIGVDPRQIELEVTETLLLEDSDRVQMALESLKRLGFRIALDDFGTGYSSLSYLRRFPFDKIKIDQTYIRSIETSNEAAQIIQSVVGLGRALQMTVTAEGVETGTQHRFLQAAGCHQLQGFLFSKPIDTIDVDALMRSSGLPRKGSTRSAA